MSPPNSYTSGVVTLTEEDVRPAKRLKTKSVAFAEPIDDYDSSDAIPSHPLGVKPGGNAYTARFDLKSNAGGFARLPDELLNHLLETLDARSLLTLGHTCKALYAFTASEELWKTHFTESESRTRSKDWHGTWRKTYWNFPSKPQPPISCDGLFSDVLYRPFFCAHTSLAPFARNIPREAQIPRLADLTPAEYSDSWTNRPFILTQPVKEWPIYREWSTESLLSKYRDVVFRAEAVDWPLSTYVSYMHDQSDESPLYLFDRSFAEKMSLDVVSATTPDKSNAAYWPPACFGTDLFGVLGPDRPDSRWLIVGPARSGSTFHKDPNATSAWNAVITGSKYWIMFPPGTTPPGVIVSEDGGEVTSPVSIAEYLLGFHELARATKGCMEGICGPGEVLHVPSGWFHLVLNLEESIAVTQNFVPEKKAVEALRFLRDSREQVSGFRDDVTDPYELFVERLGEKEPEVLARAMERLERADGPGKWETIKKVDDEEGEGGGFSFGFGGEEYDSEAEVP